MNNFLKIFIKKKKQNFKGNKVFDEYNDEENQNPKQSNTEQRPSSSRYIEKDQDENRQFNKTEDAENSSNRNNFKNQQIKQPNNTNNIPDKTSNTIKGNNPNDKISQIKNLISDYLKEKELDM